MACLVHKHGRYYAVFSQASKKKWIKIRKVDRVNAKKMLRQLEVDYAKDWLNLTQPKPISLFEFMDKYLGFCQVNKAPSSCNREGDAIKAIKADFGNITLNKIDNQAIEGYKARRVADKRKPATINKELAVIRFMLRKAVEWKYISSTPFTGIKMLKVSNQPVKFLTVEEINRLIDAASLWLKPILILLRNTGLRKGELLGLKWEGGTIKKSVKVEEGGVSYHSFSLTEQ